MQVLVTLLLLFTSFQQLMAGRKALSNTAEVRSIQWYRDRDGGSAKGSGAAIDISLVNLSNKTQNVTVKLLDQKVHVSFCTYTGSIAPSGTWSKTGTCYENNKSLSDLLYNITLGPNQTYFGKFQVKCDWNTSDLNCAASNPGAANSIAHVERSYSLGTTQSNYSFRMSIDISQDKGAIVATAYPQSNLWQGYEQNADRFLLPFNGGRPF